AGRHGSPLYKSRSQSFQPVHRGGGSRSIVRANNRSVGTLIRQDLLFEETLLNGLHGSLLGQQRPLVLISPGGIRGASHQLGRRSHRDIEIRLLPSLPRITPLSPRLENSTGALCLFLHSRIGTGSNGRGCRGGLHTSHQVDVPVVSLDRPSACSHGF